MKKIYTLIAISAFVFSANAQVVESPAQPFVSKHVPYCFSTPVNRMLSNPDTLGLINVGDFIPEFDGLNPVFYSYGSASLTTGYLYGNNGSANGFKEVAQAYQNLNAIPVKVIGALMWFGGKESDLGSSTASKVVVNTYDLAPLKAYNVNAGAFNYTVLNWVGPNIIRTSADILFSDIDTAGNLNYVSFTTPQTFVADFCVSVDFSTLVDGDTAGLVSDDVNSAMELDYAFHKSVIGATTRWFVTDQLFSGSGATGLFDNNIAIWPVVADATGVNEYFNGMKLTTYPNPAVNNITIEYDLQKDAKSVKLFIVDPSGRKIIDNAYGSQTSGTYKVNVETSNLAAGTYFYQLNADGNNFTKQFVVTK